MEAEVEEARPTFAQSRLMRGYSWIEMTTIRVERMIPLQRRWAMLVRCMPKPKC